MVARRAVIREHQADQRSNQSAEATRPGTPDVVAWESAAQSAAVRQVMEAAQSGAVRQVAEAQRMVNQMAGSGVLRQVAEAQRMVNQMAGSGVLRQVADSPAHGEPDGWVRRAPAGCRYPAHGEPDGWVRRAPAGHRGPACRHESHRPVPAVLPIVAGHQAQRAPGARSRPGVRLWLTQRACRAATARLARRSMYARFACSARRWRSSCGSLPAGSTSRSNRRRNAWRAGRVRALRSTVRLHEISAAMRRLMSLAIASHVPPCRHGEWRTRALPQGASAWL